MIETKYIIYPKKYYKRIIFITYDITSMKNRKQIHQFSRVGEATKLEKTKS